MDLYLKNMNDEQINTYVDNGNPLDKAGGFSPQSEFCVFIDKIVGNYATAVGLPVHKLYDVIELYLKREKIIKDDIERLR